MRFLLLGYARRQMGARRSRKQGSPVVKHRYFRLSLVVALPQYGCEHDETHTPLDFIEFGDMSLLESEETEEFLTPIDFQPIGDKK
jgi:hypothetical protein